MSMEKQLKDKQLEMKKLHAPDDFKEILQHRLAAEPEHRKRVWKRTSTWTKIAAVFVMLFFIGVHSDVLAYYGLRLTGYDVILSETLQGLHALGKGQPLEYQHTFEDGMIVDMEGLMLDDNNMIVYYRLSGTPVETNGDEIEMPFLSFQGAGSPVASHGEGSLEEDGVIRWVQYFEPPGFFARNLSFRWNYGHETAKGSLSLDRTKAMGPTLKKKLNTSVEAGKVDVTLKSISATPTSTFIEGSLQNIFQLGWDTIKETRIRPVGLEMTLYADGRAIAPVSSSMTTDMGGIHFGFHYDALPKSFTRLEIRVQRLMADYDVKAIIPIEAGMIPRQVEVQNQEVKVLDVSLEEGYTKVTIQTEEHVTLTKIALSSKGKEIPLERTESLEGQEKIRSLYFLDEIREGELVIQRITHASVLEESIFIP